MNPTSAIFASGLHASIVTILSGQQSWPNPIQAFSRWGHGCGPHRLDRHMRHQSRHGERAMWHQSRPPPVLDTGCTRTRQRAHGGAVGGRATMFRESEGWGRLGSTQKMQALPVESPYKTMIIFTMVYPGCDPTSKPKRSETSRNHKILRRATLAGFWFQLMNKTYASRCLNISSKDLNMKV